MVNPGLLSSKYVAYVIELQPQGYRVERRYNEFESFRCEIVRLHPGCIIAPIPKKKSGKKFDPVFLTKRKILLQSFLNSVLKHPMLKSSELFMQFLSFGQKEWEARMKVVVKLPGPRDITECKTADGKARVETPPETENYVADMNSELIALKEQHKL